MAEAGERGGEDSCGVGAARSDFAFEVGGPAMSGDVCTGEMNSGGKALKGRGMRNSRVGGWVPLKLIVRDRG